MKEKVGKIVKSIIDWMDSKKIAVIMTLIYIVSMLPIWYLSFFARPTGDDYGYSMDTRLAWVNTHSLIEVFKAGVETTEWMCTVWNGDWFSVFLFTLMPEVFVPYSFWIVPISMTLAVIGGTIYLFHEIFVKRIDLEWYESVTIAAIVLISSFQFIPSTTVGLYWYVGIIHYLFPHVVALFLLSFLSKFERTGRIRYIIYSAFGTVMIGGSSYFSSLLVFMIYFVVIVLCFKRFKKILMVGIPFATGGVALFFQITAPGNVARGGENFGVSFETAVETIISSLVQGVVTIANYMRSKTFIFVMFIVLAFLVWGYFINKDVKFKFRLPGIFVTFMYCIYVAMFAPVIYANVPVSAGPSNMQFLTFILAVTASIIYFEGWLINRVKEKGKDSFLLNEKKYRRCIMIPGICVCGLIVLLVRGMLGESTFKKCYDYIASGQANDFKEQIDSQMEILLDDSIDVAYLCPINDQQGPLMHMPVTVDPDAFTNWAVAGFYGKEKVIMKEPE